MRSSVQSANVPYVPTVCQARLPAPESAVDKKKQNSVFF